LDIRIRMHATVDARKTSRSGKEGGGVSRDGEMPEMLTARDLEALLKIDVKTIYSYVQQGLIPYVRIQSNVRFDKREILEWIAARRYTPKSARRDDADAA
jgi:predicted DNA-binding transcriptional regulator AlpA